MTDDVFAGVPAAAPALTSGPLPLWRVWHPNATYGIMSGRRASNHGPKGRFDPHPPRGDAAPAVHPAGPWVWYGSVQLVTAVCETYARGAKVVDVCRHARATLVTVPGPLRLHDLTDPAVCAALGVPDTLGDRRTGDYTAAQQPARRVHDHADGIQYPSARHRTTPSPTHPTGRLGVNVALVGAELVGAEQTTLPLADDRTLWPHVTYALDQAGVAHEVVDRCGRCP